MRRSKPHRETCHEFLHQENVAPRGHALIALPALSLFRKLPDSDPPDADPNEIDEVNGWILKRSDVA